MDDGAKDRNRRANPKDPPPGSFDWVAAKNSSTSSASGKEGGPKRTVRWPSGRGPKGTIRDPKDFPALVPPAGSSTNLLDYLNLWCRASQDVEDKQLSIFESIQIRIQQFWPFQFSNSSEEESRIRPLFKVKIFVALNIWQDYIFGDFNQRNSNFAHCGFN